MARSVNWLTLSSGGHPTKLSHYYKLQAMKSKIFEHEKFVNPNAVENYNIVIFEKL